MKDFKKLILSTLCCGFGMWVVAGLWHNLILPGINRNIHPHHEGIGILLISYFILALLMSYIYSLIPRSDKPIIGGLRLGVIIGIIWVFPHGLAMAGTHGSSILYET